MRWFNTAGPVDPADHYLIPPLSRIDRGKVLGLVRDKKYFVLHAPRQTGKTSALLALAEVLSEQGFCCVYVTVETARTARDDVGRAMRSVLAAVASQARTAQGDGFLDDVWPDVLDRVGPDAALGESLKRWAEASPRPLVLLIDEIDAMAGDSLLSVLQQLRAGPAARGPGSAGDRADADRRAPLRLHRPRCRIRPRSGAGGRRCAGAHRQPHICRGAAPRAGLGGPGDA